MRLSSWREVLLWYASWWPESWNIVVQCCSMYYELSSDGCAAAGLIFTARSSNARAVLGVVIFSVCPSLTRVLCDKTKEHTADLLIPNERAIIAKTILRSHRSYFYEAKCIPASQRWRACARPCPAHIKAADDRARGHCRWSSELC